MKKLKPNKRMHLTKNSCAFFAGDLHCHTKHSDGYGTFRENYTYARDVSGLDFCAITDHDLVITANAYLSSDELNVKKGIPLLIKIEATGIDIIKEIAIIRNNKDIVSFLPKKRSGSWTYTDITKNTRNKSWKQPFSCYYVKLIQNNNQTAWSSPIWVYNIHDRYGQKDW